MDNFQKDSWEELDVHEKRVCTGKWVGQQRASGGGDSPKASSGRKKKGSK